jgi:hypothetical protein
MRLTILLKFDRFVTLMPIENQYIIYTFYSSSNMFIEVFQPFQTYLIICPTIVCSFNNIIVREGGFGIPIHEVIDAL